MKRNIVIAAVVVALAVAVGAYAQGHSVTPEQRAPGAAHTSRGSMSAPGGGMGAMMAGGGMNGGMMEGMNGRMMPADRTLMAQRRQMMSTMNAADSKLDELVGRMKAARGSARLDAMAAVISELASEQEQAGRQMLAMEPQMMQHMLAHMQSGTMAGTMKSMQACPLVQSGEATAQGGPARAPHHGNQGSR